MRLLILAILFAATNAFANAGVLGDWKTPTDSIVRIAPCSSAGPQNICLTVVKTSPSSPETTDKQNPDPSLRSRHLCGLAVGTGFHQTDPQHLTDGHLYDPKTGHTYSGTITADADTLHLHGYIGISLFGRTETWRRVPTVTACR